jgi:hypothetical protein
LAPSEKESDVELEFMREYAAAFAVVSVNRELESEPHEEPKEPEPPRNWSAYDYNSSR